MFLLYWWLYSIPYYFDLPESLFISHCLNSRETNTIQMPLFQKSVLNKYKSEILQLQAQIDQTDREIGQMVYELYGLMVEEIAMVENRT